MRFGSRRNGRRPLVAHVLLTGLALAGVLAGSSPALGNDITVWDFLFDGVNTHQPPSTWLGIYGVTSVYRVNLGPVLFALGEQNLTITHVAVRDGNSRAGSNGVFSGLDLDFILFDIDGVPNGNEFGTIGSTLIHPGAVRNAAGSPYQPTPAHPGALFGTNALGQLDGQTATLGVLDANFLAGVALLSVNTSSGWVSLGDGGWLVATLTDVSYTYGQELYLLVGDAGMNDEALSIFVQIAAPPAQEYPGELILDAGGPYVIGNLQDLLLNGGLTPTGQGIISWTWWIDGIPVPFPYIDGNSPWLGRVPFAYLVSSFWDPNQPDHVIRLEVQTDDGRTGDQTTQLTFLSDVPEPAAAGLLALGAIVLLRRRRRA